MEDGFRAVHAHVPELGDATVTARTQYRFVNWVACDSGASDRRCVQVTLETAPDKESMNQAIAAHGQGKGKHGGERRGKRNREQTVREVEHRTRVQIVTEPATLRPRRYQEERFSMVGLRDAQGRETQAMRTDSWVEVYSY